jgi:predicted permease
MIRELEEEQNFHVLAKADDLAAAGAGGERARRDAQRAFGNGLAWREASQEARTHRWLSDALADSRLTFRMMRRQPGFAAAAVVSLALGLGAATAVFSLINGTLLHGLIYPGAQRIEFVWREMPPQAQLGSPVGPWSRLDYWHLREQLTGPGHAFASLGAMVPGSVNLTGWGEPVRLRAVKATAGVLAALDVKPELGRLYTQAEDQPGRGQVALLSDAAWRNLLHADPAVVGRTLTLDGKPYTVTGVMPRGFDFPDADYMPAIFAFAHAPQVWIPLAPSPGPLVPYESSEMAVVGRLRAGATPEQAESELAAFRVRNEAQTPRSKGWFTGELQSLADLATADLRQPLLLLLLAVGLVVVVACANVAGLLLARALARRQEYDLRAALGAGRRRLARQVLTETLWLAALGGALGAGLAVLALGGLRGLLAGVLPGLARLTPDWRLLAFGLGLSALSGLGCALAPMLFLGRDGAGLRSGKGSVGRGTPRLRAALAAGQVALALVLVVAGGLLTRSLRALVAAGGGFDPTAAAVVQLSLPPTRYADPAAAARFYESVRRNVAALPGVTAAGVTEVAPLEGAGESTGVLFPGRDTSPRPIVNYSMISAGYFRAAGAAILQGRGFDDSDQPNSPLVAVVNRALAEKYFPGEAAVGREIEVPVDHQPRRIVGVVANLKHQGLDEAVVPEMYAPITQKPWPSMLSLALVVRARPGRDGALPSSLRQQVAGAVHAVDPDVPLSDWMPLTALVAGALAPTRLVLWLMAGFGGLTLLLAAVGLYGVVAYAAGERRREFGVRLALGASRGAISRLVLRQGLRLALAGVAAGLLLAMLGGRLLQSYLYGVRAWDPATLAVAPLLLGVVLLVACLLPARRAARLDPVQTLRQE